MKTLEEIKELAEKVYREFPSEPKDVVGHLNRDINCHRKRKAFVKGYTQCQEDMADNSINFAEWLVNKYFMIHDKKWNNKNNEYDESDYTTKQLYDIFKNSLNKKD